MGEAEKALTCNQATPYVDSVLAFQAQDLQKQLNKCTEARKVNDWKAILKETQSAISLGADSALQVSFLGLMFVFRVFLILVFPTVLMNLSHSGILKFFLIFMSSTGSTCRYALR